MCVCVCERERVRERLVYEDYRDSAGRRMLREPPERDGQPRHVCQSSALLYKTISRFCTKAVLYDHFPRITHSYK